MSRRGRSKSPFSLFSFQDIVTSVTAIIILVTLMLTVELLHRQPGTSTAAAATSAAALKTAIDDAKQEVERLESLLKQGEPAADEAAAALPHTVRDDLRELARQVAARERECKQLAAAQVTAQAARDTAAARSFERAADREVLQQLYTDIQENKQKIEELQAQNRLIYNASPGGVKQAILVDVTGERLLVGAAGQMSAQEEFRQTTLDARQTAFLAWAQGRDSQAEYFVMLIRPSGVADFDGLEGRLKEQGFDIGYDLIAEDQTIFDVTHGAAP